MFVINLCQQGNHMFLFNIFVWPKLLSHCDVIQNGSLVDGSARSKGSAISCRRMQAVLVECRTTVQIESI